MGELCVKMKGLIEIKCKSLEEALEPLDDEVDYFFVTICHYMDAFIDAIFREYSIGDVNDEKRKFLELYLAEQKAWFHNSKWKTNLRDTLIKVIQTICVEDFFDYRSQTYKYYYCIAGGGWNEVIGFHWYASNYGLRDRYHKKGEVYFPVEYLPYYYYRSEKPSTSSFDRELNVIFQSNHGKTLAEMINNLCNSPWFPNSLSCFKSHSLSFTYIEGYDIDFLRHEFDVEELIRKNRQKSYRAAFLKKTTEWIPTDYEIFPISPKEREILATISTLFQKFITIDEVHPIDKYYRPPTPYAIMKDVQSKNPIPRRPMTSEDDGCFIISPIRNQGLNIVELSLEINKTEDFSWIQKLLFLDRLILSGKTLTSLPNGIIPHQSLKKLNLRDTRIFSMKYKILFENLWGEGYEEEIESFTNTYFMLESLTLDDVQAHLARNEAIDISSHIPSCLIEQKDQILQLCENYENDASRELQSLLAHKFVQNEIIHPEEYEALRTLLQRFDFEIPVYNRKQSFFHNGTLEGEKLYIVIDKHFVTEISLDNCELIEVPPEISHFKLLSTLVLSNNFITELPLWMIDFHKLDYFWCENNQFSLFPFVITFLNLNGWKFDQDIEDIYLSFGLHEWYVKPWSISDLSERLINNKGVIISDLLHPGMITYQEKITGMIDKNPSNQTSIHLMEVLEERNTLVSLGKIVGYPLNVGIYSLDFTENTEYLDYPDDDSIPDFTEFPEFSGVGFAASYSILHISYLSIPNRDLTTIPSQVFDLKHLEKLNLAGNPITSLPSAFTQLQTLDYIDLRQTRISHFPKVLLNLPKKVRCECTGLNLDTTSKILFEKKAQGDLKVYLQERYQIWDLETFVVKLQSNIPADFIDETLPHLLKIRELLEERLRMIDTDAAREYLQFLIDISSISPEGSKYPIYL